MLTDKASVNFLVKVFLTSRRAILSVVKQLSYDIIQLFAEHCSISGANIQACLYY